MIDNGTVFSSDDYCTEDEGMNMQLCYIEDVSYKVMSFIPNVLIYCCSDTPNFIRVSANSALASAPSGTFFL